MEFKLSAKPFFNTAVGHVAPLQVDIELTIEGSVSKRSVVLNMDGLDSVVERVTQEAMTHFLAWAKQNYRAHHALQRAEFPPKE